MVHRVLSAHDFVEGVRALLVDKDRRPRWQPSGLGAVPTARGRGCMAPLPAGDLRFDWHGV